MLPCTGRGCQLQREEDGGGTSPGGGAPPRWPRRGAPAGGGPPPRAARAWPRAAPRPPCASRSSPCARPRACSRAPSSPPRAPAPARGRIPCSSARPGQAASLKATRTMHSCWRHERELPAVLGSGRRTFFLASSLSGAGRGAMRLQALARRRASAEMLPRRRSLSSCSLPKWIEPFLWSMRICGRRRQPQTTRSGEAYVAFIQEALWRSTCGPCKDALGCSQAYLLTGQGMCCLSITDIMTSMRMHGCSSTLQDAVGGAGAHLEVALLDGLHNDLLHLAEAEEGHQLGQRGDRHHAVHLRQLLHRPQHSHLRCRSSLRTGLRGTYRSSLRMAGKQSLHWRHWWCKAGKCDKLRRCRQLCLVRSSIRSP